MGFMLENISQLKKGMSGEIEAFQNVVDNIILGLSKMNKQKLLNVQTDGVVEMVEHEQKEAKKVLKTLKDEEKLIEVLDDDEKDISAVIADDDAEKCSVVKAPIMVDGHKVASIGVFGPQKMDYMGIATALKIVVDELGRKEGV